jgi:YidC/Oxa1 family membrane protein insertase
MSIGAILYSIFISPLQMFFEVIFGSAQRFTGNYGLSICILSLIMNFLVLPLYKRADAMQAEERDTEAKLHDGLAHIKKTFSGDERMMMQQEYYRQNHYKTTDAFKGSVSLFLEIPFFIAAYQFLSTMQALHGVSFGPITDLGAQDGLLSIGGMSINLLPILMTCINVASCIIYTKGYPLKTKIQLYVMAAFFFFFLYDSPAGLLFYWTLNNLFSLLKNIFYKLKNPGKVLAWMSAIAGVALMSTAFLRTGSSLTNRFAMEGVGVMLIVPLLWQSFLKQKTVKENVLEAKHNGKVFLLAALLLTVMIGALIPSSVISASAQEFTNLYDYHHPLWYVVSSFCLSFGTFVIWFGVFYELASEKGKVLFEKIMWTLCGAAVVNYMFFGTKLGNISAVLVFDNDFDFTAVQKLINLGLLVILAVVMFTVYKRYKKFTTGAMLTGLLAVSVMSGYQMIQINAAVEPLKNEASSAAVQDTSAFTLSKTGQNVVVLMLDRAIGPYVPYIMNEKPELKEQFSGFTYFENTASFGECTNFGAPALYGGYEYTPAEIDKRSSETLLDKNNESLKVMPVLFDNNGYKVTVADVPYGNYQWITDLSIYDDHPNISQKHLDGKFNNVVDQKTIFKTDCRNFFCYSIMKTVPIAFQHYLYNYGNYFKADGLNQNGEIANATNLAFLDTYNVLKNLSNITEITDTDENTFLMMNNDTTHNVTILQEPDYVVSENVDNAAYDAEHANRYTLNGKTLNMSAEKAVAHYHVNMAAFLQLGNWFDYLRANGVYDNTKIILVSDHGFPLGQYDNMQYQNKDGSVTDLNVFGPLLMVKDYNSTGFTTSEELMTNGDVPTIATQDAIDDPINPYTGKEINSDAKNASKLYLFASNQWDVNSNHGNQFNPDNWYSVHDNIWDPNNWEENAKNSVLPDETK